MSPAGRKSAEARVRVEFGRGWLAGDEVRRVQPGTVLPGQVQTSDPVTVYAAGRPVARGVTVNCDGKVAVRITELLGVGPEAGRAATGPERTG